MAAQRVDVLKQAERPITLPEQRHLTSVCTDLFPVMIISCYQSKTKKINICPFENNDSFPRRDPWLVLYWLCVPDHLHGGTRLLVSGPQQAVQHVAQVHEETHHRLLEVQAWREAAVPTGTRFLLPVIGQPLLLLLDVNRYILPTCIKVLCVFWGCRRSRVLVILVSFFFFCLRLSWAMHIILERKSIKENMINFQSKSNLFFKIKLLLLYCYWQMRVVKRKTRQSETSVSQALFNAFTLTPNLCSA